MPSTQKHPDHTRVHHETSDVDIHGVFGFAFGLSVVGIAICVCVWLLFLSFAAREARRVVPAFPLAADQAHRLPPEPRLQTHPRQDLRDLRSTESALLTSYGWVDKNAGVARIPIGAAMTLIVKRGLPERREKP